MSHEILGRGVTQKQMASRQGSTSSERDEDLVESPASGARVAMFAIAIAVVLGAVFYGLNGARIESRAPASPVATQQK